MNINNSNSFADDFTANPFEDSSIQQARNTVANEQDVTDFNPFNQDRFNHSRPAVLPTTTEGMDSDSKRTNTLPTQDALRRQQEELERRAAELDEMERNISSMSINNKNFPPIPVCCPLKPCFRQDFNVDIPQIYQRIVRFHFFLWIAYSIVLIINVLASLAYFIASTGNSNAGVSFGLSILYGVLYVPLSYVFWFRAIYKAFQNNSSMNFFIYFFIFAIQSCLWVIFAIGIPGSGGIGFISGLGMVQVNSGVGIFMIIIGAAWVVLSVLGFLFLLKVLHLFRTSGASLDKAQQEFASGVISNPGVRRAATDVVASAFVGQQQQGPEGGYMSNKY